MEKEPHHIPPQLNILMCGVWMRNIPHKLTHLNTWSLVGGTVWRGYETFRRCSLARKSMSLEAGFRDLQPHPTSCSYPLVPVCAQDVISQLPTSASCCHAFCSLIDSVPQLWTKTNSFLYAAFDHGISSQQQKNNIWLFSVIIICLKYPAIRNHIRKWE